MVASTGGVDVLPGSGQRMSSALYKELERLSQSEAERRSPFDPTEATASQSARACP